MTKKILALLISIVLVGLAAWRIAAAEQLVTVESGVHMVMGTFSRIVVVAPNEASAQAGIQSALSAQTRIDLLMSYQREDSELARINAQAGDHPVVITPETMAVLQEARRISQITNGAFDISVAPLIDLWKQASDTNTPPTDLQMADAKSKVDWTQVILDPNAQTVAFGKPGMKLDLGGIAKGYGIDLCIQALKDHGAAGGMVDIGGDIRCFGRAPNHKTAWHIALQDPRSANHPEVDQVRLVLKVTDRAVTTSGHYYRFEWVGHEKVSHIIDSHQGTGASQLSSVTILAPTAMTADALATAVSVMGHEQGLALIETLPDIEAIVIDADSVTMGQTPGAHMFIR
ncbi:MAG: FAD:protein FMN transferase [Phycisphaerae bacterium]|nr:FAD:protein FMN transferase [Phycisphaerae bacterium]